MKVYRSRYGLCSIQACTRRSMCTAVVGGSTHRAATRVSAAANHSSPAVSTSHRTTDRSTLLRRGVLNLVSCLRITSQDTVRKFAPRLSTPQAVILHDVQNLCSCLSAVVPLPEPQLL